MGRIFLVRHGQTELNQQGILQGPRIDVPLSERGEVQAHALASALEGVPLDVVLSSPLLRARQTAKAIIDARPAALALQQVPELYELDYGDLAGQPSKEVEDRLEQVFDAWRMGFPDQAMPGGESALLATHRVRSVAQRILESARDELLCVVGHGWINRILLAQWTGKGTMSLDGFPQDNAAITELEVGDKVRVVRLNDQRHLDLGA